MRKLTISDPQARAKAYPHPLEKEVMYSLANVVMSDVL